LLAAATAAQADSGIRGLPFTRLYPVVEIGTAARGAHLNFDRFGRLAVVLDGTYAVLNDTSWVQLAAESEGSPKWNNVIEGADGRMYFGARGAWGTAELAPDGRLHLQSLVSANAPAWARNTSFDLISGDAAGIYFAGPEAGGIVYRGFRERKDVFFELHDITALFPVGSAMFVAAREKPLQRIDVARRTLSALPETGLGNATVNLAAPLNERETLLYASDGRLMTFDGNKVRPWPSSAAKRPGGTVTALQPLADGGVALAIRGKGLFLFSLEGELTLSLPAAEYHSITRLACNEPGVLWVLAEDTIQKILYADRMTSFGQRLGLPLSWPTVVRWGERTIVLSGGNLYEAMPAPRGAPNRFELWQGQPALRTEAAAAIGSELLIGNADGVFAREADDRLVPLLRMPGVVRLAALGDDLCFVFGREEIAVLRRSIHGWAECAARRPIGGFPHLVHPTRHAVWIEYGGDRVARVWLAEDGLHLRQFAEPAWEGAPWVNVGVVDDIVVLSWSNETEGRSFFDENTGTFGKQPALQQLLARAPRTITRVHKDAAGVLWGTYREGVVTFTPVNGDYEIDRSSFDIVDDRYPRVQLLPGNDTWITGGRSLYHIESRPASARTRDPRIQLVSLVDGGANVELINTVYSPTAPLRLELEQHTLRFTFFSGGYAWRRAPSFEFRLARNEPWASIGAGAQLSFSPLREGDYRLEARTAGREHAPVAAFEFQIVPPWYRTWPAFAVYALSAGLGVFGIVRWSSRRSRRRAEILERLVHERTRELESAMNKLNEETRIAATLAERNRLAGEIHDSLQQGLSGAILQLDTTLTLPSVPNPLRSRLEVVRNMVSFTRHEVQHAVWDMESPLLEDTELGEAIHRLTRLINSGTAGIDVRIVGVPWRLPPDVKHHLLRIAQETTTNAVRHAAAKRIRIVVEYTPGRVALEVSDDGVGFCPDNVLSKSLGHFGLRGIHGRAKRIRGKLEMQSAPGRGTTIRIAVDAPAANAVSPKA
jgi:signal transduction histidine kinase